MLAGSAGVVVVTTLFGAGGAGLAAYKMERRLGAVTEFRFLQPKVVEEAEDAVDAEGVDVSITQGAEGLLVCLCVSGWLVGETDSPRLHWWQQGAEGAEGAEGEEGGEGMGGVGRGGAAEAGSEAGGSAEARAEVLAWLDAMGFEAEAAAAAVTRCNEICDLEGRYEGRYDLEKLVMELVAQGETATIHGEGGAATEAAAEAEATEAEAEAEAEVGGATGLVADAEAAAGVGGAGGAEAGCPDQPVPPHGWSNCADGGYVRLQQQQQEEAEAEAGGVLTWLPYAEHHALLWEPKQLRALGSALKGLAATEALTMLGSSALKHTFLAVLMSACAFPAYIIKSCDAIDNPWAMARGRAIKAGRMLAHVLVQRVHGARPVVLVGFSLGALLVFECLGELARLSEAGEARAAGIVQHAVLMGLPASSHPDNWLPLRRVVAGRLVSCYRPGDLVLSLVHRANSLGYGIAGLEPVRLSGVESLDVSAVVTGHSKYRLAVGRLLEIVNLGETKTPAPAEAASRPAAAAICGV